MYKLIAVHEVYDLIDLHTDNLHTLNEAELEADIQARLDPRILAIDVCEVLSNGLQVVTSKHY